VKKKAAVVVDPSVLEVLMGMGFSEQGCRRACVATNNNADASMEWILEHMGDEDFNDPLPTEEEDEAAAAATKENNSAVDTTPKKEKGNEAGIKRDNSGEPKPGDSKPSNDQGAESEDAMVDDVETLTSAPAPVVAPPVAAAVAPVTTPNAMTSLTFDFSQFASGSTLPAPPTTGATAPTLDIGAMIAALSASAQAAGSRPPASAPAATSSSSSQAPPPVMKEDRALFVVADDKCVELVLSDAIVGDEESGGNRQLGFVFLYEVLTGSITLKLADKDVSKSLAEIMLR
jgi:hypothetical protein